MIFLVLSSPGCSEINVMTLFNTFPRTKRSHGHKRIQHPNVKKSDSNFHRQTAVMTRLIEMIIQNPVFGISCIISMLAHSTSQCLTSFTNIQKSTKCTFCGMLITSPEFTSKLTGKTYYTKSFDPLDCSTKNVIYDIECTLCPNSLIQSNSLSVR
jgi:hypothetical protein